MGNTAASTEQEKEDTSLRAGLHSSSHSAFQRSLVRERNKTDTLEDYYEVLNEIGRGGLCKVYKIRKKYEKIGGSSRSDNVKRKSAKSMLFRSLKHPMEHHHSNRRRTNLTAAAASSSSCPGELCFALKEINLGMVPLDKIDQLKNEVEILKALDHKNIIKAYETFQASKRILIIMELCTGGDLRTRFPYTEGQAARVTRQVLSAVQFMHDKSIIHRDLKLENIMFENEHPDSIIKVIDFGLSKAYSQKDHILSERVGTLYCMSPETMLGDYTSQADLWSVGVCTYMLLSGGDQPFPGRTPKQMVAKVLLGQYTELNDTLISQSARNFIQKLLVVETDQRMTSRQARAHPWLVTDTSVDTNVVDEDFKQRVREAIVRYAESGEFIKLAMNVIAKKSTSEEIFALRSVFDEFDIHNTGTLTLLEFQAALAQYNYTEEDVEKLFRKIDVNGNNEINYTEFLAAALETQGQIEEYRIAEAFDLMDVDDSGYISRANLRQILGNSCDEQYIGKLISEADFYKDGRVSYPEFLQAFNRHNRKKVYKIYETKKATKASVIIGDNADTEAVLRKFGIVKGIRRAFNSSQNLKRMSSSGETPTRTPSHAPSDPQR